MGFSMPDGREIFGFADLVESFAWDRFSPVGPIFDLDKLDWLNGVYLRALSDEEFGAAARPFLPPGVDPADLGWVLTDVKERTKRLSELRAELTWLAGEDVAVPAGELTGKLDAQTASRALTAASAALDAVEPFEPGAIVKALDLVCTELGVSRSRLFMTVRVAVTGSRVSPPLDNTIAALGRARATHRLRHAAATISP
jgi:glutamyl-tRNA synthetase